jgi:hypothetical protein
MWGAIIGAVGSYLGNREANKGNNKATQAGLQGQQNYIDELKRQFDINQANQAPWLTAGKGALGNLQSLLSGDYSGFMDSPDYKAALQSGIDSLDKSAAARGSLFSGGHSADLTKYAEGLATSNLGNYRHALESLAGVGQSAADNLGSYGQNYANSMGSAYQNMGNLRGSSYQNNAYNNAAMWSNLGNAFGQWYGNRNSGGGSPMSIDYTSLDTGGGYQPSTDFSSYYGQG